MEKIRIDDFLISHDIDVSLINLGDFDYIGEYTAKKMRDQKSPQWKSHGAFFRPAYERGILIHELIRRYNIQSYLEIGYGRGYSAICAAKALCEIGAQGHVITIDPQFDENNAKLISQVFPREWIERIQFAKGTSQDLLPKIPSEHKFDFVYIDGDHRAEATQSDWDLLKDKWDVFCLFDDYHLPTKKEADIECSQVIDKIEVPGVQKQLIILDRRMFNDDRGMTDDKIDYGQVLLTRTEKISDRW